MRIDLNPAAQALSENHRSGAAGTTATGTTATGNSATSHAATGGLGEEDQAELCRAHAQVQALVAQAAQLPDVREERVQALRQAIQRGYYQSSPEEVAGAVFAHMIAGPAA